MFGFSQTSLSYKLFFVLALVASLFSIGTVFTSGFANLFFLLGIIVLVALIIFHYMSLSTDIGEFMKYLFVVLALAAILLPSLVGAMATNPGFDVVKRGNSKRVVFNHSFMIPYLDEWHMSISSLQWERQIDIEGSEGVSINVRLRFEANQNKDLVRELVRKYDSEERIRDEIKKIVTSKFDTL